MKHILFIGCSNLVNDNPKRTKSDIWKDLVLGTNCQISNLSSWGVGNQFICHNLYDYLEKQISKIDYIYLQFSGIARYDVAVHDDFDIGYNRQVKTYRTKFLCSGGKVGSWLNNSRITEMFMPLYYKDNEYKHIANASLQAVNNAVSLCEKSGISFNWCFYYNILKPANEQTDNYDGHIDEWPKYLSKKNFIENDPHTFCFQNNGILEDGCHFNNDVYAKWLLSIKDQLTYQK